MNWPLVLRPGEPEVNESMGAEVPLDLSSSVKRNWDVAEALDLDGFECFRDALGLLDFVLCADALNTCQS
jgi:hypothetical protein